MSMFRRWTRAVAVLAFGIAAIVGSPSVDARTARPTPTPATSSATNSLQLFSSESAAQAHCPRDVVVWLNTGSGIWHEKGMRWYGNTKQGAYVCRQEAATAGDRDTRNGQ